MLEVYLIEGVELPFSFVPLYAFARSLLTSQRRATHTTGECRLSPLFNTPAKERGTKLVDPVKGRRTKRYIRVIRIAACRVATLETTGLKAA